MRISTTRRGPGHEAVHGRASGNAMMCLDIWYCINCEVWHVDTTECMD